MLHGRELYEEIKYRKHELKKVQLENQVIELAPKIINYMKETMIYGVDISNCDPDLFEQLKAYMTPHNYTVSINKTVLSVCITGFRYKKEPKVEFKNL